MRHKLILIASNLLTALVVAALTSLFWIAAYGGEDEVESADDAVVLANWRRKCMQMLEVYLRRFNGISAEKFMERWAWVLFCVQENRSWTSELLKMAEERFEQEARSDKPFLKHHRPSFRYEQQGAGG